MAEGPVDAALVQRLIQAFSDEHKREYGYTMPSHIARVEIANVRLAAVGSVDKPQIAHSPLQGDPSAPDRNAKSISPGTDSSSLRSTGGMH